MQKLKYNLIISDFDGTLVCDDGRITEENKRAIKQYVDDGGRFAISTGRMHYGVIARAKELGLTGVICCSQGAVVMDIETQEFLLNGMLSADITLKISKKMEALGLHYHIYEQDTYYTNVDDEALHLYEKLVKKQAVRILDKPLSEFVLEKGIRAYKVLAMVKPEDNSKIMSALERENFEGCNVTKSADFLVEVINAQYSKGTAVEFLAKYYGIDLKDTIAIGDQLNDLPMLTKAGLGLSVKNASEEVKALTVALDYTNEESAVAKAIAQYGYGEK